jgi:hypothetical protein
LKKITFLFLLSAIISLNNAHAQIIKAYGFKVAYTSADQRLDYGSFVAQTERRNGFNVAVYAEWLNLPFLSLITQIEYAQRGVGIPYLRITTYDRMINVATTDNSPVSYNRLDYISIPVLVKLSLPEKVLSPYIVCGPRCDFLLAYKEDHDFLSSTYDKFKKVLLGGSAGFGLELNSVLPVGMVLEARYNFDLSDSFRSTYLNVRNNSFDVWLGVVF